MESKWYKKGLDLVEEIKNTTGSAGEIFIWFLGQSGYAIRLGKTLFFIDAVLNDLTDQNGVSLRNYEPPFAPEEIDFIDYYVSTHGHDDHMPLPTILTLEKNSPGTKFIVPAPLVSTLVENGISNDKIIPAQAHQSIVCMDSPASVLPLPSPHTEYRKDEKNNHFYLGYVFKYGDISIYHSGDAVVTDELVRDLQKNSPINIALLPVNGSDWERTNKGIIGNMNARDAVMLAVNIPFDLTIPGHYDMFRGNGEDPSIFVSYMYQRCPDKRFHILALGERLIYR